MRIGMIGLGKMGANMSERLLKGGHEVVAYDLSADALKQAASKGAETATSLEELAGKLSPPRAAWVMLPAGKVTKDTIDALAEPFDKGDVIVDGGNSKFTEAEGIAEHLAKKGVGFVDAGTSGGVWGLTEGYCLMVGGTKESVALVEPALLTLAPEGGYAHVGPVGAGHFVKMVHNGIEYGMMQAYAEGFDILRNKDSKDLPEDERFVLNMPDIAEVWRRGSVISSWLLDLGAAALAKDPQLKKFSGFVQDSGEGRWTIEAAIEEAVPADVLSSALYARFRSRQEHTFGEKMLSAMRFGFGGHIEGRESIDPESKPEGPQGH